MPRLLELKFWSDVCHVTLHVVYAILILFFEKIVRIALFFLGSILPKKQFEGMKEVVSVRLFKADFTTDHSNAIQHMDTPELIEHYGYKPETHFVTTSDGFMLTLHRVCPRLSEFEKSLLDPADNESDADDNVSADELRLRDGVQALLEAQRSKDDSKEKARPVVFLMHGFMMCSESFTCLPSSLAYTLADAGCDVWLGNSRGNKYSSRHTTYDPSDNAFWDFCLDDVAAIDLPANIQYIRKHTGASKVAYVGFSQGTAVGFAAFSTNYELAKHISVFCALAATCRPNGFHNIIVDALAKTSPDIVYLLLGRKNVLPSTLFWQNTLSQELFIKAIDQAVSFLFGWDSSNIAQQDKLVAYYHLYSYSSVKSVVHWFQLMRSGGFHMHEGRGQAQSFLRGFLTGAHNTGKYIRGKKTGWRVPAYPIGQLACPAVIFMGTKDGLPDNEWLRNEVSDTSQCELHDVDTYEHLDFIFSHKAQSTVYPTIIQAIEKHS